MGKCLVTKLNGVVDADLLKMGEFRMKVLKIDTPTKYTQSLSIKASKYITLRIVGDGYFTDADLNANLGKTLSVAANTDLDVYYSNGDYEIYVSDKYSITNLTYPYWKEFDTLNNRLMNVEDLTYAKGLSTLRLLNGLTGDLSKINTDNLTDLYVYNNEGLYGDISKKSFKNMIQFALNNTNVSGDTTGFRENTSLTFLRTINSDVLVRTSDFKQCTKLDSIIGNLTGDLTDLKDCIALKVIASKAVNLVGDIALLPANLNKLGDNMSAGVFTWSSRPSSFKRFAITSTPSISNVDKMLQDMAACVDNTDSPIKQITARGTRTTASDTAVSTLQSEGWTVYIIE